MPTVLNNEKASIVLHTALTWLTPDKWTAEEKAEIKETMAFLDGKAPHLPGHLTDSEFLAQCINQEHEKTELLYAEMKATYPAKLKAAKAEDAVRAAVERRNAKAKAGGKPKAAKSGAASAAKAKPAAKPRKPQGKDGDK
ncbi:hypothetical protein AGMMS49940_10320 [Spirochaetia bacterium]|nr:hypothetical protein AGMMS49940_10320 [Spirochaetia bacterium]